MSPSPPSPPPQSSQQQNSSPHTSHESRTAAQPRQSALHRVILTSIWQVNPRIRLLRLGLPYAARFLPGQWLDVFIPALSPLAKAGGFTITSSPSSALLSSGPPYPSSRSPTSSASFPWAEEADGCLSSSLPGAQNQRPNPEPKGERPVSPFFELAIQKSPSNPPAEWLWRPERDILGQELLVRVGGGFVWPPPHLNQRRRVSSALELKGREDRVKVGEEASGRAEKGVVEERSEERNQVKRLVMVAGGVGINPLISILTHLAEKEIEHDQLGKYDGPDEKEEREMPSELIFLYATRVPGSANADEVLFLPRLERIFEQIGRANKDEDQKKSKGRRELHLFVTGSDSNPDLIPVLGLNPDQRHGKEDITTTTTTTPSAPASSFSLNSGKNVNIHWRRLGNSDLLAALDSSPSLSPSSPADEIKNAALVKERKDALIYVCGPPAMTDEVVQFYKSTEGVDAENVLCERWW